ncbi:hypothetical protein CPB83DRAFT_845455 [Crepidotus variabilis]|uniref:Vomeronasal type-1 receptor n=1 Tax=Crepidotus variabilis TaxID=179855 RepID=A0A9P6ER14_9AGAR|nr:hypothetical protein CPB83DRAFT_845455 [Crepidotus variabilis]
MTILLLLISSITYITQTNAHAILASPDEPTSRDSDPPNTRTVYSIVYSCFATIFLCTWVSFHPNIPAARESSIRVALRRVKNMLYGLFCPEIMLCWAMNQWFGARSITHEIKAKGWTNTHSFFLQMGGFQTRDGTGHIEVLIYRGFHTQRISISEIGKIGELVTVQEIQDKSKSDFLSKALGVAQTTWFIAQCVARGVQGLGLTEMELLTVALAALNGFIYFFWWSKPMDVRSPILVHLKPCQSHAIREVNVSRTADPEGSTRVACLLRPTKPKSIQTTTITSSALNFMFSILVALLEDFTSLLFGIDDVNTHANAVGVPRHDQNLGIR